VNGGKVAARGAEVSLQSTVSPAMSGTMVCSQSAVASVTWPPLISPIEPWISVVPFARGTRVSVPWCWR